MTSHLHISKFEILIFFNKIHKNKIFQSFFSSEKCAMSDQRQKVAVFLSILLETLRISNFEMCWDVVIVPFSKKVTCTKLSQKNLHQSSEKNKARFLFYFNVTHCLFIKIGSQSRLSNLFENVSNFRLFLVKIQAIFQLFFFLFMLKLFNLQHQ